MKTATVRDLRNRYTSLLDWIDAGEEIVITQRGRPVARLIPEQNTDVGKVDWSLSPAVKRNRPEGKILTATESLAIVHEAGGKW